MSQEIIELLRILKDETQSRLVLKRCEDEIALLQCTKPAPAIWYDDQGHRIIRGGETVRIK